MFNWLFQIVADLLAFFYWIIPNYFVAICLLTVAIMAITYPLTAKQTRNMIALNRLQPEIKKLQELHKDDKQKQSEEMMALYKRHNINPLGGCLPMILQLPLFIVMFRVISGLTHVTYPKGIGNSIHHFAGSVASGDALHGVASPQYIPHTGALSSMYHDLVNAGGQMMAFGIDLAKKVSDYPGQPGKQAPIYILIALSLVTQYISTKQIYARNKKMGANAQSKQMMRMQIPMLILFAWIGIRFPAGVLVYWVVQGGIRIAQQWGMYKYDRKLVALTAELTDEIEDEIAHESKAAKKTASKRTGGGRQKKGKRR